MAVCRGKLWKKIVILRPKKLRHRCAVAGMSGFSAKIRRFLPANLCVSDNLELRNVC